LVVAAGAAVAWLWPPARPVAWPIRSWQASRLGGRSLRLRLRSVSASASGSRSASPQVRLRVRFRLRVRSHRTGPSRGSATPEPRYRGASRRAGLIASEYSSSPVDGRLMRTFSAAPWRRFGEQRRDQHVARRVHVAASGERLRDYGEPQARAHTIPRRVRRHSAPPSELPPVAPRSARPYRGAASARRHSRRRLGVLVGNLQHSAASCCLWCPPGTTSPHTPRTWTAGGQARDHRDK